MTYWEFLHQHNVNRPFTSDDWQSLGDLKERLVEKGLWDNFHEITHDNTLTSDGDFWNYDVLTERHWSEFDKWLLNPGVFIPLVDEFLRKEKG